MKRGANTRNQDTEAGSRYPSILRTNSTEKTVKLNRVGADINCICLVSWRSLTWPDRSRSQRDWRRATLAAPSVWTTWWHSELIKCRLLLQLCHRNMQAADNTTLDLCEMFMSYHCDQELQSTRPAPKFQSALPKSGCSCFPQSCLCQIFPWTWLCYLGQENRKFKNQTLIYW